MLNKEQVKELKNQLLSQIENLPEDKKAEARKQIESLSPQALELMLKQQGGEREAGEENIFRLIVKKEVPSSIIAENQDAIAVLEINPISKGHTIIIPKTPIKNKQELPEAIKKLSKAIEDKIKETLKPSKIETAIENKFGEIILDIIPVYDKPINKNKRYKAKTEELEELKEQLKLLEKIEKPKIEQIKIENKKTEQEKPIKLKRRIP